MKKLFVGNLNFKTQKGDLEQFFAEFGPLMSCDIVMDRMTGESRGFGFVEFEDSQRADDAVSALNGRSLDGKELRISEAKPREDRGGSSGGGGRSGGYGGGGGGGGRSGGYSGGGGGGSRDGNSFGRDGGGYGRDNDRRRFR